MRALRIIWKRTRITDTGTVFARLSFVVACLVVEVEQPVQHVVLLEPPYLSRCVNAPGDAHAADGDEADCQSKRTNNCTVFKLKSVLSFR